MRKTLMIITVLLMLASVSKGMEPVPIWKLTTKCHPVWIPLLMPAAENSEHIYNTDGYFVTVPASIVSSRLATIAGMPLTVPLCALYEPFGPTDADLNLLFRDGYRLSANILYTVGGLPFYIVKKILWDGPVYLYEAVAGENEEEAK